MHGSKSTRCLPTPTRSSNRRMPCCDCSQPLVALLRHSEIADGLPLSVEERSCSGRHCKPKSVRSTLSRSRRASELATSWPQGPPAASSNHKKLDISTRFSACLSLRRGRRAGLKLRRRTAWDGGGIVREEQGCAEPCDAGDLPLSGGGMDPRTAIVPRCPPERCGLHRRNADPTPCSPRRPVRPCLARPGAAGPGGRLPQ